MNREIDNGWLEGWEGLGIGDGGSGGISTETIIDGGTEF